MSSSFKKDKYKKENTKPPVVYVLVAKKIEQEFKSCSVIFGFYKRMQGYKVVYTNDFTCYTEEVIKYESIDCIKNFLNIIHATRE